MSLRTSDPRGKGGTRREGKRPTPFPTNVYPLLHCTTPALRSESFLLTESPRTPTVSSLLSQIIIKKIVFRLIRPKLNE